MAAQFQIINKVLQDRDFGLIDRNNLTEDYFYTYSAEFNYIKDHYSRYGVVPDTRTFKSVFEDFKIELVQEPEAYLVSEIRTEYNAAVLAKKYNDIKEKLEAGDIESATTLANSATAELKQCTSVTSTDITSDFSRFDRYQERVFGKHDYYITTGIPELDMMIGGIDACNENMVIVARTGVGKSWCLLQMAAAAYASGKKIGIYSGEMSVDKVAYRIDTILGHISNKGLNRGDPFVQSQYEQYLDHMKAGTLGEIVPNYLPGGCIKVLTPVDLGTNATVDMLKSFIEKENLDMLFVDQYSLLEDTSHAKQSHERVANISKAIKNLQVLTQKPIIAVSQMNRSGGKNADGDELEADSTQIGLSDRIGQDATTLIYLSKRPISDEGKVLAKYEPGASYSKYLFTMTIGKARDGGEGKLEFAVDLDTYNTVAFIKGNKLDSRDSNDDDEASDSLEYRG